jgi:ribosomal protein L3 glutamine methyltransferase
MSDSVTSELVTVRDWLRFAVSRFTEANLAFGHGTATALDEAAYLILHTLHLPIDQLEPWLDARVTRAERATVAAIIEKRVVTRKPAPYLTHEAWIQGHKFYVDERVIVPRSYIGELLARDGLAALVPEPESVERALDMCTGSGCLAIIAAKMFPNARVDAVDLSKHALEVAARNVAAHGLADRVSLIAADLFDGVLERKYDLIISNPPYVAEAEMVAFPPEYQAEPAMAHAGGKDGLDLVRRILADAPHHLTPQGRLVVEIGTGREKLETEFSHLPFFWLDSETSEGEVFSLSATDFDTKPATKPRRKPTRKP